MSPDDQRPARPLAEDSGTSADEARDARLAAADSVSPGEQCSARPLVAGSGTSPDELRDALLPTGGGVSPDEQRLVRPMAGGSGTGPDELCDAGLTGANCVSPGEQRPARPLATGSGTCPAEQRDARLAAGEGVSPGEERPAHSLIAGSGTSPAEQRDARLAAGDGVSCDDQRPARPLAAGSGTSPNEQLAASGSGMSSVEQREAPPAAGSTSPDEVRRARAYLLRVAEPPAPALIAFVAHHGPIDAAARVRRGDCPPEVLKATEARREYDLVDQDFARAAAAGARLVVPEDDEWPAWPLLALDLAARRGVTEAVPPLALWVSGDVALGTAADRAVAVVGARAATEYGEHHAAELAYGLAGRGVPVFSGAAYGIDGAAHRGALAAEGITVAVLGCADDAGYPAGL